MDAGRTELDRQIRKAAFERTMLSDLKLATASRVLPDNATGVFKDSYLLDFLDLPDPYMEADLQTGLLQNLRQFLLELGEGFAFVGEKIKVQVGNQGFELDLLFYHRDLQCLVAFESKTGRFEPEYMGKLAFTSRLWIAIGNVLMKPKHWGVTLPYKGRRSRGVRPEPSPIPGQARGR